jgi:hypothetical protein
MIRTADGTFPGGHQVRHIQASVQIAQVRESVLWRQTLEMHIYSTSAKVYTQPSFYNKSRTLHSYIRITKLLCKLSYILDLYCISKSTNSQLRYRGVDMWDVVTNVIVCEKSGLPIQISTFFPSTDQFA